MNPTVKTIVMWALILAMAVASYNMVERSSARRDVSLSFTDFLDQVEKGQVAEVTITGSTLEGRLRTNSQSFLSVIPSDYPTVYEKLIEHRVKVTVIAGDQPDWLTVLVTWLLPMLFTFGLGWLCALRFHRQPPAPLTI